MIEDAGKGVGHDRGSMRIPAWFVAHGSPMLAIEDNGFTATLAKLGRSVPAPDAIVIVSAHWQTQGGVRVTSSSKPETIHDFGGFDPILYTLTYAAPGNPKLARDIAEMIGAAGFAAATDSARGLDHGAWVPLRWAFPDAAVPVVQVSLPFGAAPPSLLRLGAAMRPLRERGVLLIGSGGVVHNLRLVDLGNEEATTLPWAHEFDRWIRDALASRDIAAVAAYRERAPHAALAVPTSEHYDPLLVILGAMHDDDHVVNLYEGFQHGSLSLRSVSVEPLSAPGRC